MQEFTKRVISLLKSIPPGSVSTYGKIAAMAGSPKGARQVVRILHIFSQKEKLPWHRVVNREGKISIRDFQGYELQRHLLENEGVIFNSKGRVDLETCLWAGEDKGRI